MTIFNVATTKKLNVTHGLLLNIDHINNNVINMSISTIANFYDSNTHQF